MIARIFTMNDGMIIFSLRSVLLISHLGRSLKSHFKILTRKMMTHVIRKKNNTGENTFRIMKILWKNRGNCRKRKKRMISLSYAPSPVFSPLLTDAIKTKRWIKGDRGEKREKEREYRKRREREKKKRGRYRTLMAKRSHRSFYCGH